MWNTFHEVDQGKLSVLESAYDSCREQFLKKYHEDYSPLDGREDGHSVCVDQTLNLTVEGISYDIPPEAEYKFEFFSKDRGCLVFLLVLFIIACIFSYIIPKLEL